ncbi:hypothetical protein EW093_08290 [Thiospirochaeta perfilievii]|uniref:RecBCD enzyme subunit RecB n=1 Tax=Thiospirochaeta perfilievii TaxID=252967 RepID=A0A5C1Q9I5_9SPIO|nr:UvrD-helicase domain-containing protein [Thiospirochaeta perfilievii]QEN04705.1 hypothetical protein EW093_08290 [Thiospirochaeta perfilievii]
MIQEFRVEKDNSININLRENLLLEASAGTGKTYTLERVVLNLIKNIDYNLTIKDILVVTFTNKATREMKERIRKILISEYKVQEDPQVKYRIEQAISEFDEASIYTIHGFCQNTLQTFPFESLSLFNQEINRDSVILENSVWDYLRSLETTDNSKLLEEFYSFRGNKEFSLVVKELMSLYDRGEFNGELNLFPGTEDSLEIYNMKADFESGNGRLIQLIQTFKMYNPTLMLEASKAMSVSTRITSFEKVVKGFEGVDISEGFYPFIEKLYTKGFCDNLFKLSSSFLEGKSKKGLTINDIDETSREIILNTDELFAHLEPLFDGKNFDKNPIDRFLSGEFIKKALKEVDIFYKKRQESMGVLSYNDLIDNLHKRVMDKGDESLLIALRKKYKVALIDEFQDTDKKQWDIFNRVFGGSKEHNFLLIGDPKQSIYGFRGADLEIYYKAKESVLEKNRYFLGTNYRSEDGIVTGVNKIFSSVFAIKGMGNTAQTTFIDANSSGKDSRFIDESNKNIEFLLYDEELEDGKTLTASMCKRGYFNLIVNKIVYLLNNNKELLPGEISILVENHKDSIFLRDKLLKKSVPVVISKQKNVYKSNEALDLLNLLKALNRPGGNGEIKTLLLSNIFAYSLKEIHEMEENGGLEILSTVLLEWSQRVVHSGLISVWKDVEASSKKGHLQTRLLSTINGERSYTNYKHLIEDLNIIQKSERLNSLGLYQRLHSLIESSTDDEENSVRLDRDSQAVQIMTIHASKGLEFPVVFFAGGFDSGVKRSSGYGVKYAEKGGVWTLDFLSRYKSSLLAERDEWEEKKRLYYVALTRAGSKLYLPIFKRSDLLGISSLYSAQDWDETKLLLEDRAGDKLEMCEQPIHRQLKFSNSKISKELKLALTQKIFDDISREFYVDKEFYQSEDPGSYKIKQSELNLSFNGVSTGFRDRVTWLSSYSALTRNSHGSTSKEDADRNDDEEVITPEYKKSDELNSFNLPGGATFGDFIHELFEEIDFSKYKLPLDEFLLDEDVENLTVLGAKKHFDLDWLRGNGLVVKKIIWNTLNSRLPMNGVGVPLGEFGPERRIHEREFYFRVDKKSRFSTHGLELSVDKGYVKGFIDLILNNNGVLYIADWKSTTIKGEESFSTYSSLNVEKSMNEHNYHLQGLIYTVALYIHLKKTKENFDYSKDIGGYYYLFVRGMSPESDTGICFYKPLESEVLSFINDIRGEL